MDESLPQLERATAEFARRFGDTGFRVFRAPGRVNLIGEHTDYNGGFVMPVAIDREVVILASPRNDQSVHAYSINFDCPIEFALHNIEFDANHPWSNYLRGVAYFLLEAGVKLHGMNAVVIGDVPVGSGLSSSAALEVASAVTFQGLDGFKMDRPELALLCQRAENEFVGARCGIMDQFVSCLGQAGSALFIDCRSLGYRALPLNRPDVQIVVCDTEVKRTLVASEYNLRREQCEQGVAMLKQHLPGITALRDVGLAQWRQYADCVSSPIKERCAHVIEENDRVLCSTQALESGDLAEFGRLMNDSHTSLRDQYQVSCPELDALVESAQAVPGVPGSRMTGAGFGGCTVSLVERDALPEFRERVSADFERRFGRRPPIYVCTASAGAGEVTR